MELVNYTPFPHLLFESRTPEDRPLGVLVLRGTFEIVPGETLRPVSKQDDIAWDDVYRGEPGRSSLSIDSDLSPFKPRTDIHVEAIARAPGGEPAPEWTSSVRVGSLRKDLRVLGPSVWQHFAVRGWRRTKPVPVREVRLAYELSFGGSYGQGAAAYSFDQNPVGTGFINRATPTDRDLPAPQIVAVDEPEHEAGKTYTPQGTGPLAPSWQPRLARAGTFDAAWEHQRWPCLPADFDWSFYNSAHPDLTYPTYLRGDEAVALTHLSVGADVLTFRLPGFRTFGLLRKRSGELRPFMVALDTVRIDVSAPEPAAHRVHLTWRGTYWMDEAQDRVVEARLELPGDALERTLARFAGAGVGRAAGAAHG